MKDQVQLHQTRRLNVILGLLTLALAAGTACTGFFSWRMKVYTPDLCTGCTLTPPRIDPSFFDQALIGPYGLIFFAYCGVLAATSLLYFPRLGGGGNIQLILAGIAQIIQGLFGCVLLYILALIAQIGDYAPGVITYSPAYYVAIACFVALIPLGIFAEVRGTIQQNSFFAPAVRDNSHLVQ